MIRFYSCVINGKFFNSGLQNTVPLLSAVRYCTRDLKWYKNESHISKAHAWFKIWLSFFHPNPFCSPPKSIWNNHTLISKTTKNKPDHISTDSRTIGLNIRNREWPHPPVNSDSDLFRLCSPACRSYGVDPFLKFPISSYEYASKVVHPRKHIMIFFMPSVRTFL